MTTKTGRLDGVERTVRLTLAALLLLLAWGFDWTSVEAIGALALAAITLTTGLAGSCLLDRGLARLERLAAGPPGL